MVNIARVVERAISEKPFLLEALAKGVINNAALAEQLLPIVEKELKKKVKFSAANMAVRRFREKLGNSFVSTIKFDAASDISLRSSLVEMTIDKTYDAGAIIKRIYDAIDFRHDYLAITQGSEELTIITNARHENKIRKLLGVHHIKKTVANLASVSVRIPESSVDAMGLFYLTSRTLNWENINIVEIVSTLTELVFIVKQNDASRAFDALAKLIDANK
jgi:hypothetical protein